MITSFSLRDFWADRRGVAAVEFAFVAPILIIFYLGMAETCQLLIAKRRVDHAGAAVADLVTQEQNVTKTRLGELKEITSTVLAPLPSGSTVFNLQLTSVRSNATTGALECVWAWPTACAVNSAPSFTVGTPLAKGESVVASQVTYTYTSGIGYLITSGKTLNHKAELRPRKNDLVTCSDC